MSVLYHDGEKVAGTFNNADGISYDNTSSGIKSTNVQDAVDELHGVFGNIKGCYFTSQAVSVSAGGFSEVTIPFPTSDFKSGSCMPIIMPLANTYAEITCHIRSTSASGILVGVNNSHPTSEISVRLQILWVKF